MARRPAVGRREAGALLRYDAMRWKKRSETRVRDGCQNERSFTKRELRRNTSNDEETGGLRWDINDVRLALLAGFSFWKTANYKS